MSAARIKKKAQARTATEAGTCCAFASAADGCAPELVSSISSCLFCGAPRVVCAIYYPPDQWRDRFHWSEGEYCAYGVCRACRLRCIEDVRAGRNGMMTNAEHIIARQWAGRYPSFFTEQEQNEIGHAGTLASAAATGDFVLLDTLRAHPEWRLLPPAFEEFRHALECTRDVYSADPKKRAKAIADSGVVKMCALCQAVPETYGFYIATEEERERWGGYSGCGYGLCASCAARPDLEARLSQFREFNFCRAGAAVQ